MKKSTKDEFIEKANLIHDSEYDYSKVIYDGNFKKVIIICKKHGEFEQTPNHHLQGCRCPECLKEEKIESNKQAFINRANIIYNNKYDYNKVDYINNHEKVIITCHEHGDFLQSPKSHLEGYSCPKCGNESKANKKINKNKELFIPRAREVHGDRYNYSKVVYKGHREQVCIICPIHGEFWQTPDIHLSGGNCQKCKQSSLEYEIEDILKEKGIMYEYQKHFEWLNPQSLDFYLPGYNVAIECQGEQHYRPVEYFGGEKRYEKQVVNDAVKAQKCQNNEILLLYYSKSKLAKEGTFDTVEKLITEIISYKHD